MYQVNRAQKGAPIYRLIGAQKGTHINLQVNRRTILYAYYTGIIGAQKGAPIMQHNMRTNLCAYYTGIIGAQKGAPIMQVNMVQKGAPIYRLYMVQKGAPIIQA